MNQVGNSIPRLEVRATLSEEMKLDGGQVTNASRADYPAQRPGRRQGAWGVREQSRVRSSPRPAYARMASFRRFVVRRSSESEGGKRGPSFPYLALDTRLRGNERRFAIWSKEL
jgi:hypothetical protein